jgi:hypothetical protein
LRNACCLGDKFEEKVPDVNNTPCRALVADVSVPSAFKPSLNVTIFLEFHAGNLFEAFHTGDADFSMVALSSV